VCELQLDPDTARSTSGKYRGQRLRNVSRSSFCRRRRTCAGELTLVGACNWLTTPPMTPICLFRACKHARNPAPGGNFERTTYRSAGSQIWPVEARRPPCRCETTDAGHCGKFVQPVSDRGWLPKPFLVCCSDTDYWSRNLGDVGPRLVGITACAATTI
jgi:hypothetical protein